jgi:hypothetical protein
MPRRDNQGRDLDAVRRQFENEARLHREGSLDAHHRHEEIIRICPLADWTRVEGVLVLRSGDSNFVAVPTSGADSVAKAERSRTFDVISLEPREPVVQLLRSEVRNWLWRRHQVEKGL